jgi:hypothetical protein
MNSNTADYARTRSPARTVKTGCLGLLLAAGLLSLTACDDLNPANPDQISQAAVDHAHHYLGSQRHGKDILGYVHFGAAYRRHAYLRTVNRGGGSFALVYRYNWEDDGVTDIAFNCDTNGRIESVRIEESNGRFSQPFGLANLTINVLGNALFSAFKDDMNEQDQRQVQRLIDQADAKSLLEWSLRFQQHSEE